MVPGLFIKDSGKQPFGLKNSMLNQETNLIEDIKNCKNQYSSFKVTSELEIDGIRPNTKYPISFLINGNTPGRVIADRIVKKYLPMLEGNHVLVELGSGEPYYSFFASKDQKWLRTDLDRPGVFNLDARKMLFNDNSVDSFLSVFMLEHVFEYEEVVKEIHRCLKPKGRALVVVPFLIEYHGVPYDYFRWTPEGLKLTLKKFKILTTIYGGGRFTSAAMFFHEKIQNGSQLNWISRTFLRLIAFPLVLASLFEEKINRYPTVVACLIEK